MKNCLRMKRIALKHEPQRKNICAGRMIRRKKARRERASVLSPGAARRASFGRKEERRKSKCADRNCYPEENA